MRKSLVTFIPILLLSGSGAFAVEAGISSYTLGATGFNAGITPPAGTYVTPVTGFYSGIIDDPVNIGGLPLDPGSELSFFKAGMNVLYVPELEVLGGALGLSATVATGHIDFAGAVFGFGAETEGWGVTDTALKAQLGWAQGTFFHTAYVAAILPTGEYDVGLYPSTGLNRAALDAGWGFTWIEPSTMIQVNGTLGFTYNFGERRDRLPVGQRDAFRMGRRQGHCAWPDRRRGRLQQSPADRRQWYRRNARRLQGQCRRSWPRCQLPDPGGAVQPATLSGVQRGEPVRGQLDCRDRVVQVLTRKF